MTPPILDQRRYQDILQQLLKQAGTATPPLAWKYAQPAFLTALQQGATLMPPYDDIGLMIAGLYARLAEMTLERLNAVPAKNLLAFLDTLGISLLPPAPARAPVTFTLTQGNPPTPVPQGALVATQASGQQPALLFSTEQALNVLPATITRSVTIDPVWDRFTEQTPLLGAPTSDGMTPWVGAQRMPHLLYLGSDEPFGFVGNTTLTLMQFQGAGRPATALNAAVQNLLQALQWQYSGPNGWTDLRFGAAGTLQPSTSPLFTPADVIVSQQLQGVGVEAGAEGLWLCATLPTAIEDTQALYDSSGNLLPLSLILDLKAGQLLPQAAFANNTAVDLNRIFLPFGSTPQTGDVFMLGSDIFGYAGANITLTFALTAGTPQNVTLIWEYLNLAGWQALPIVQDSTADLKGPATSVTCTIDNMPADAVSATINNQNTYWIRMRIAAGNYGVPPAYELATPNTPTSGYVLNAGNLDAPCVSSLRLSYERQLSPTVVTRNGFLYADQTAANATGGGFTPFTSVAAIEAPAYSDPLPAFYLGLDSCYPQQAVTLYFAVRPRALAGSVDRQSPPGQPSSAPSPITWEYYNGLRWTELSVVDQTAYCTEAGIIEFLTPADMALLARFDLTPRAWIRACVTQTDPLDTPLLSGVFLNTVEAVQAVLYTEEILGSGSGLPGQSLTLANTPVQPAQAIFVIEPEAPTDLEQEQLQQEQLAQEPQNTLPLIDERTNPDTRAREYRVQWQLVSNFVASTSRSRHYTLDRASGSVTFGDGTAGMIPPSGTNNILATYQAGGGMNGNVVQGTITQLHDTLPGVAGVTNPLDAEGGAEIETAAMVAQRGPQTLRHRGMGIAPADVEWLARQAAGTYVARALCLPNIGPTLRFEPGWITLIVVPRGTTTRPQPGATLVRQVEQYLLQHVPLLLGGGSTSCLNVVGPGYLSVSVVAEIVPQDILQAQQVRDAAATALDQFLHPLTGGRDGTGWEFGRAVYESEIARVLQHVPGIDYLTALQLQPNSAQYVCTIDPTASSWPDTSVPVGTIVRTSVTDSRKSALLAEPLVAGKPTTLMLKGFKEGDRVTVALDATIVPVPQNPIVPALQSAPLLWIALDRAPVDLGGEMTFPRGSAVIKADGSVRTALTVGLNATTFAGARGATACLSVDSNSGFNVGDEITVLYPFPLTIRGVQTETTRLTVVECNTQPISAPPFEITVTPFETDAVGLPSNSRVQKRETQFDSARVAWVAEARPPLQYGNSRLNLKGDPQDETVYPTLMAALSPGDVLDVYTFVLALDVAPYQTDITLPAGYVLTTLDNRVRLPLAADLPANQTVQIVSVLDFKDAASVTLSATGDVLKLNMIDRQQSVAYVDANYLVCPGTHALTLVSP